MVSTEWLAAIHRDLAWCRLSLPVACSPSLSRIPRCLARAPFLCCGSARLQPTSRLPPASSLVSLELSFLPVVPVVVLPKS